MLTGIRTLGLATFLLIAPLVAESFEIYESTSGPGAPGTFAGGTGQLADVDFDADSAAGGGIGFGGPSEIRIVPTGDVVFTSFGCQLSSCVEGQDYRFIPGGAGLGEIIVSDRNPNVQSGAVDLGQLAFNSASGDGHIRLTGCNYTGADGVQRDCVERPLMVPEPGLAATLVLGTSMLGWLRRRSKSETATT